MTRLDATDDERRTTLAAVSAGAMAQAAAENFPVAMRLLPAGARADLRRVYLFARFVDDVGDRADGDRSALLDSIETELRALWGGRDSSVAAVAGLRPLITAHAMPAAPFLDLVEANRLDQRQHSYASFDDLLGYCRLSAAPIGQIVLHLAGAATDANLRDSDAVCAALQVLEHCQDVGEDARAGRVYLPGDDLDRAGVTQAQLTGSVTSPELRAVVAVQVARARDLMRSGHPLVRRLSGWGRFAVTGYIAGGQATAAALARADYDVLARAVQPTKARTIVAAIRLIGLPWA